MFATIARRRAAAGVLLFHFSVTWGTAPADTSTDLEKRGEYVFRIAGCAGCHTAEEKNAKPLEGGRKFETRFGTFYTPNITPHPVHGIGRWSLEDLSRALRNGVSPGNIHLYPVFPYTSYAGMVDDDVRALMTYLRQVPRAEKSNQPHELPWYLRYRPILFLWKQLFHSPERFASRSEKSAAWNRGAYLVNVLGHCGECHTPRNFLGGLERAKHLGGNADGPEAEATPNITTHPDDGIGSWSAGEIREYLRSGLLPDGDVAGGQMAGVIEDRLSHLTDEDIDAIVVYLQSVPALED